MTADKDPTLEMVVSRLRSDLGNEAFDVVDHWSGDQCAIGIARPGDHGYLVYISTYPPDRGSFGYQCERPSESDEAKYAADSMTDDVPYAKLVEAVRQHLTA